MGLASIPGQLEFDSALMPRRSTSRCMYLHVAGCTVLVHLPDDYKHDEVRGPLTAQLMTFRASFRRSPTWDQGPDMREGKQISAPTGVDIFYCDPRSPKGTDLPPTFRPQGDRSG